MKKYIPSLNGLRALSILFVLFAHVELRNLGHRENPGGQIGVTIFFILSGFLITTLLLAEEQKTGSISLKNFFFRRMLRIFPVYYVLLAVYALLQLANVFHLQPNSWISALFYLKYFPIPRSGDWETGHLWSLSVEEHFYLIWPFIFTFLPRLRKQFAFAVILVVPLIRILFIFTKSEWIPVMSIFQRADSLMIGCVLAIYYEQIAGFVRTSIAKYPMTVAVPFVVLLGCLTIKRLFMGGGIAAECISMSLFGSFGSITDMSIAILIVVSITQTGSLWYKFLNLSFVNYLGKLSYSLYIWQQLFFSPYLRPFSNLPMNLLYMFIVANLSYYFVELQFLKLKTRYETLSQKRKARLSTN